MDISFFKIFRIFGHVSNWAEKSLEDGKVTIQETIDLAEGVAQILGIPLEVDFAPPRDKLSPEASEKIEDLVSTEDTQGPTKRPGE